MDEEVFGFDVSVDDAVLFEEFQRYDHLRDVPFHDFFLKISFLIEHTIFQSALIAVLEDKIKRSGAFFGIDVFENVGMVKFAEEVDFLEDGVSGDEGGVDGDLFDGEFGVFVSLLVGGTVVAQVDFGHCAFSEHFCVVDLVLAD